MVPYHEMYKNEFGIGIGDLFAGEPLLKHMQEDKIMHKFQRINTRYNQ